MLFPGAAPASWRGTDERRATATSRTTELVDAADVLIHELTPNRATEHGLDDASLVTRNPGLIVCSVLSWPANHADADPNETPASIPLASNRRTMVRFMASSEGSRGVTGRKVARRGLSGA